MVTRTVASAPARSGGGGEDATRLGLSAASSRQVTTAMSLCCLLVASITHNTTFVSAVVLTHPHPVTQWDSAEAMSIGRQC
jgi:hypothetical protein